MYLLLKMGDIPFLVYQGVPVSPTIMVQWKTALSCGRKLIFWLKPFSTEPFLMGGRVCSNGSVETVPELLLFPTNAGSGKLALLETKSHLPGSHFPQPILPKATKICSNL